MVLRMPCPTKRKGSDNWYFRRTIPADIQRILAKLPAAQRPRNWYRTHIAISLRTADRATAKAKCPEVAATVEAQIKALREGPKALSRKQIAALVGDAYRAFASGLEDDPVLSAKQWRMVAERHRKLLDPSGLTFDGDGPALRAVELEPVFGRLASAVLARRHIVTDEASRHLLLESLAAEMPHASEKLARNAEGDYSPDTYSARFPALDRGQNAPRGGTTLTQLAAAWYEAALARKVTARNAKRARSVMARFAVWLGHDDASLVTRADVANWADARVKGGTAASTINKVDTAALRAIFEWGAERGLVSSNPLAKNVRVHSRGRAVIRDKFFSAEEVSAILRAALAAQPGQRESEKTAAARRWVPFLCAYSGARVAEMIQLRKQDLRKEAGAWIARLTPEAGGIKTNEFRDVPLHEHLVALGFLDFANGAGDDHLFCSPNSAGDISGSAEGVYNRLREFVRGEVSDPNVAPNHAWRSTFKTAGVENHIPEVTLDAICGHGSSSVGRKDYTRVTLKARIEAIKKFPRYSLASPRGDT